MKKVANNTQNKICVSDKSFQLVDSNVTLSVAIIKWKKKSVIINFERVTRLPFNEAIITQFKAWVRS